MTAGHVAGVSKKWEVGLGGLTIGSVRGHEVAAVRMPSPCHGICGGHDLAIGLLESPPRFRGAIPALATRAVFAAARSSSQGLLIAGFGFGGTRQQVDEAVLNSKRDGIKRFGRGGPVRGDSVAVRPALGFDPRTEFVAGPAHPEDRFSDVCEGDSGGPAFWTDPEGQLWLLGIASRNAGRTGECGSASIFTRIDAWRRWIIETASSFGVDLS
ncbi:MAG: trypsin-like serine protease [Bryobacterales bacterium]|nr:trypsin-like serine protease [Bryobacterales bacterium]